MAALQSISSYPLAVSLSLVLATLLSYGFTRLYHARMIVSNLKKQGLPVAPGHNFLFGHLLLLKKYSEKLPKDAHYQYIIGDIYSDHFQKEGAFYIDLWPMSGLCFVNPKLAIERPRLLPRFFKPIAGGPNLFDMREAEWRPWRSVFSKGFSTEHFLSLVPGMVKETMVYAQTFRDLAEKGEMFSLDTISLRSMMDVIGRTILAETNPFGSLNVARWYMEWRNGRRMDKYIGDELDRRYAEFKADSDNSRTKAVMDIILQAYMGDGKTKPERLDPEFRAFAIRQIRLFVFVGHDSTSSTICYILHLLSQHPDALNKIRAEHDGVFGKNLKVVSDMLISQPHLTNDLPYTTAVIKETLRLFPPASCSRQGKPDVSIPTDSGALCPMDDAFVFIIHVAMQRAPAYWVRAAEFLPECFLVEPGHELFPVKGAWRPFEHGPRNCIAQGLVMIELKVILVHLVREFEFKDAYEEWDTINGRTDLRQVYGDRAFQIEEGSAHSSDHYPCRVTLRK
ncbi:sterigmatocystin biosynthesis P450 monooxygenase StcS [Mollisia scopiformis]|uniref:Sterigmatocystin biosynthesis P450 monooxygenase StcS n=1 Tax=Mollisia scopiformis TaxID=149040 RepID=A0A194XU87_MOLSC|nr:sterigmatocystin biosynthesis P450 monooxygenase StcS [Mollisia scopiformis]KUJ23773.1 sterigmatocystin biosynthesis P450 monooxygenase StcS [Mollisia scopiformis]